MGLLGLRGRREAAGELAVWRGRNRGPCSFLAGVLHPEQGPCCLAGEEGQRLSGRRYEAVWLVRGMAKGARPRRVVRKACCGCGEVYYCGEVPGGYFR